MMAFEKGDTNKTIMEVKELEDGGGFVPADLKAGEQPTLRQKVQSILAIAGVYYVTTHKVLKPLTYYLLKNHPQWKALASRAGTFNKSAQDEIVYVGMAGLHHVLCAGVAQYARTFKGKVDLPVIGKTTDRSLYLYAMLTEFAFEWTDFALMALKQWPYQDRDPKFTALLIFHHLFGLLNFKGIGSELSYVPESQSLAVKLLGVAGVGCLAYPVQQLMNLETRSGNKKALLLNLINMACHVYVRFFLYFTDGMKLFKRAEEHLLKTDMDPRFMKVAWAGYGSLTIFNVVVFLGGLQKTKQYITALRTLKH